METYSMLQQLKEHLYNITPEEFRKEVENLKEYKYGPTAEEYIEFIDALNKKK